MWDVTLKMTPEKVRRLLERKKVKAANAGSTQQGVLCWLPELPLKPLKPRPPPLLGPKS